MAIFAHGILGRPGATPAIRMGRAAPSTDSMTADAVGGWTLVMTRSTADHVTTGNRSVERVGTGRAGKTGRVRIAGILVCTADTTLEMAGFTTRSRMAGGALGRIGTRFDAVA